MLTAKVIVNPSAGAGRTARRWPEIMSLLKSLGLHFEHDMTEAPGHAIELAKLAVRNGYELIVSVGGDGTINEVVNGLYDSGDIRKVMLGIINTGSGGDYVRTVGISRNCREACCCLVNPGKLIVDLGVAEYETNGQKVRRVFLNFAGLGFDAEITRATTQRFKALGSTPSYLMGLLTTLLSYRNRDVSLIVDGVAEERKVCTVMMSNGKYGGGGMLVAPNADPADGLLDVVMIDDLSKPELLRSLPRIYRGTHLTHPKVTVKRAREVNITSGQEMLLQIDGELLGKAPARFRILPAMLNVAV
ncbi:MAG: diacylglycerol kinase family protein [Chloroflexota bacterium]